MNRYIENLKSFLSAQTPYFRYADANSILEMLYYYYAEANPIDNAVIHCQFKELHDILDKLSLSDGDALLSVTSDLCISHERQAFLDGIHVGMRLFSELDTLP